MKLTVTRDDSTFIYASIGSLEEHLIWGSLFAAIVVMFFIRNIRAVVISALAIPASIIATFTLMRAMDFTLNNMTLLGITLAVGIVIDDAIVVLENIFRYIEEKKCTPFDAAIQGTREVALAVMATTLSLVVIFLPIAFMTGYARRFINPFGWSMAFSIMVSMLVSFTLTPMLSSRFLRVSDADTDRQDQGARVLSVVGSLVHGMGGRGRSIMPGVIIGVSAAVFLLTFPLNRMIGRTFVPDEDMGEWTVHLDSPEGTSFDGTSEIVQQLVKELDGIKGVLSIEPSIQRGTHLHLLVHAEPFESRAESQFEMIEEMRRRLRAHPSYRPSFTIRNPLGGGEQGGFPINAKLLGPDLDRLSDYSMKAFAAAQRLPSLADPKLSLSLSNPEIHVAVDRKRAADLGVRMATIGSALRLAVAGDDEISTYREGGEQYPVKIRVLESQRRDLAAIGRITVPSASGAPVRIDNLAKLERGLGPSQLQRANRQFSVGIVADIAPGHALDEASNDVRKLLADLKLPPDMSFSLSGQTKILDETTQNLIMAIALAMIFVYMVLAAQFESFVQPIVIMLALPLSVPFALFTLWATHRTLNLWSALGMLLLLGIVKKNSILQVDYANVLRATGMPLREAIVEACRTRLRPILMTTSAIVAGLVPTALGLGIGGQGRAAIAVTIIGGQSLCLFLTLLLVPVAYVKLDSLEQSLLNQRFKSWMGQLTPATIGRVYPSQEPAGKP